MWKREWTKKEKRVHKNGYNKFINLGCCFPLACDLDLVCNHKLLLLVLHRTFTTSWPFPSLCSVTPLQFCSNQFTVHQIEDNEGHQMELHRYVHITFGPEGFFSRTSSSSSSSVSSYSSFSASSPVKNDTA